jgi:hypothetical protein
MPPRDSAREAGASEDAAATTALSPLPLPLVLHIFSLLPVDCRLRCMEVCRGWRSVLLERSLWTRLELSRSSGVLMPHIRRTLDGLLRCAAARADGGLQALHIGERDVSPAVLLEVATANAGALRELQVHVDNAVLAGVVPSSIEAVLAAAPLLRVFNADVRCTPADADAARRVLRNAAPFGLLRVGFLTAYLPRMDEAGVIAFAADVAVHAWLTGLSMDAASLSTAAALRAVVDAALACRLHFLRLFRCRCPPNFAPALARLLRNGALTTLECSFVGIDAHLLDAPAVRVLAAALRANATLTSLALNNVRVFHDAAAGAELLGALRGHASLRVLNLNDCRVAVADGAAMVAAFAALVAANAPALTELHVSNCVLRDDGLRPLFEALPHNTHLRTLNCRGNGVSDAFVRDVALPAVRANTGLRETDIVADGFHAAAEADLERVLRSRAPL